MEELDLKDILLLFWRKRVAMISIIAIFIGIGVIYTECLITPKYTSSTTLVLASKSDTSTTTSTSTSGTTIATDLTVNSKLVSTYSELVKSKTVLRQVISDLNLDNDVTEEGLRKNIKVSSVKDTELIEIDVTNENPSTAADIANQISTVFTDKVKEIYKIDNVYVVDKAEAQTQPSNINHTKDLAIFALIGFVIAVFDALLENMLDTTVKSAEEIEKQFSIPVLASIPLDDGKIQKGGKK